MLQEADKGFSSECGRALDNVLCIGYLQVAKTCKFSVGYQYAKFVVYIILAEFSELRMYGIALSSINHSVNNADLEQQTIAPLPSWRYLSIIKHQTETTLSSFL